MKLKCEEMKGQEALGWGKVKFAANKPEWCCLIFITEEDGGELSLLWDEKHAYMDMSRSIIPDLDPDAEEYPDPHVELTDEQRDALKEWIYSYCEN